MAHLESLNELVFRIREASAARGDLVAITRGERTTTVSTTDFLREIHALAVALDDAGLEHGERVAIYCENRPEWHVVDLACQLLGAPTVPIAARLGPSEVAFVLRNSGARWVFYGDERQRDILRDLRAGLTRPPTAIAFDGDAALDDGRTITRMIGDGTGRLADVPIERFRGRAAADDVASLAYTRGPDGEPCGAMLDHRALAFAVEACGRVFDLGTEDRVLSFSPLSRGLARALDHLAFVRGAAVHHVPDGLDLSRALAGRRPTVLVAPPRVYAMVVERTRAEIEGYRPRNRRLASWALAVGARHATAAREGFIGPFLALQRWLAHRSVLRHIQRPFGGRLRLAISDGEPLADDVVRFFEAVGLPLVETYGFTETSPVLTACTPEGIRRGTVGEPLTGVDLRITDDGDILVRGPGTMRGYWQNPEATAAALDDSGWFRTGDRGRVDRSGHLVITERRRDRRQLAER